MSYQFLTTKREGPVEYLTLNRPEVRNALNDDMIAELAAWAAGIGNESRDLRAVVLGGAGKVFCAGADVAWMSRTIHYTEEQNLADAMALSQMFTALDRLPLPLIGRIQGAALGGGAGLAAVCDIVVAEEEAVFGFTEVKLGILPAVISPFALAKIGRSAARELFLTGVRFSARRAYDIGLVHAVAPAGTIDVTVSRYVGEISSGGPEAISAAKALIREVSGRRIEEAMPITANAIATRRVSPEGQEGLRAFLEKRKPSWTTAKAATTEDTDTNGGHRKNL
jgi:methylglutaconyl-CoA hydratase